MDNLADRGSRESNIVIRGIYDGNHGDQLKTLCEAILGHGCPPIPKLAGISGTAL